MDTNEADADAAIAAVQADVDANEAATVKLTGNQTVNGVKTFNSDLLARLRGNVRTTNAAGAVSLVLNTNVGSDSPAVFTGNVVGDVSGAVGTGSGVSIFSEWNSIYIGSDPSSTTVTNATPGAKNNLSLGKLTLSTVTTGDKNTAIGLAALKVLTTGYNNNVIGYQAGNKLTTGFNNDMFGFQAGTKVTTGQENVLVGRQSGYNLTTGKWNVFVGKNAGAVIKTGQQNTIIGNGANVTSGNTGAVNRTAIGAGAIASTNNTVVLGNNNVTEVWMSQDKGATVYAAEYDGDLTGNVTGNVTGDLTGNADTATALSTAIGINDLSDASFSYSTENLVLSPETVYSGGYTSALLDSYGYSNVTLIGAGIAYGGGYLNSVVLGNSYTQNIFGGSDKGATFYGAGFEEWSDKRLKTNIKPLGSTLTNLSKLEGKKYFNLKSNKNTIGLIAQDILKYYPELVSQGMRSDSVSEKSDEISYFSVNYNGFIPILVNAVNEQQEMIKELQEKLTEVDELKEELESLKQLIINNN